MPKHTSSKLPQSKCATDLAFDGDTIMEFSQYKIPFPNPGSLE
jgi:hypothetical protein